MSAESAVSPGRDEHRIRAIRRGFRTWRGQRPFWAGLFTLFGGIPIAYFPYATFKLGHMTLAMQTTAGAGALIIGVLLMTLGLTMWFHSIVRVFAGVATILLALVSIPIANMGGFFVGFLFSLIGGALSLSWVPGKPVAESAPVEKASTPAPDPAEAPVAEQQLDDYGVGAHETNIEVNGGRNSAG
ncbi:DUF6114 domain-containing protein [Streptomyces sp. NBC_01481]|uniref:DUF6114 domain-containing protein n=1 Tax=Streptomyces sp. NBC_01481 TaxID=2975869 RepID=UPI002252EB6C|nr:DUF6114 domain-containing protein [Streptomyces sp. NBC_01481]MCX4587126.1 DUF6114 domain-containing protein [Streptomyces sp. NBC_01481]